MEFIYRLTLRQNENFLYVIENVTFLHFLFHSAFFNFITRLSFVIFYISLFIILSKECYILFHVWSFIYIVKNLIYVAQKFMVNSFKTFETKTFEKYKSNLVQRYVTFGFKRKRIRVI